MYYCIQCPLISCDMLYHHVVSCMIFNWPVPKLQLIHWSRDALWLMVWYCHIIQLLYAQAIQCIIHPFHRLYTAWRRSAIIQSSTLKPGDHPSGESSKHHTTLHICHNHHNRWLCKKNQSSVKFSNGYVKETDLILHKMCSFTKSEWFYTNSKVCNLTHNV